MKSTIRRPQVCVLGSAEPGSRAYQLAADAGAALAALGLVPSIVPPDENPDAAGERRLVTQARAK